MKEKDNKNKNQAELQNKQTSNSDLEKVPGGKVECISYYEEGEGSDYGYWSTLENNDCQVYWESKYGDRAEKLAQERDLQLSKKKR